jgi:hypothetical protein
MCRAEATCGTRICGKFMTCETQLSCVRAWATAPKGGTKLRTHHHRARGDGHVLRGGPCGRQRLAHWSTGARGYWGLVTATMARFAMAANGWLLVFPLDTFDRKALYGSWTHHRSHPLPHPWGTPDTPGLATGHHDLGRVCPPGPRDLTGRRWGPHHSRCLHGRHQPPLCLQMGAAVSRAGPGGLGRRPAPGALARVVPPWAGGTARGMRVTRRADAGEHRTWGSVSVQLVTFTIPTVCPLTIPLVCCHINSFRSKEAKICQRSGHRITRHDEAMVSLRLPCAPPGCP